MCIRDRCGGVSFSARGRVVTVPGWKAIEQMFLSTLKQKTEKEEPAVSYTHLRGILAQRLGISPQELTHVTNSGEGEGLLFFKMFLFSDGNL